MIILLRRGRGRDEEKCRTRRYPYRVHLAFHGSGVRGSMPCAGHCSTRRCGGAGAVPQRAAGRARRRGWRGTWRPAPKRSRCDLAQHEPRRHHGGPTTGDSDPGWWPGGGWPVARSPLIPHDASTCRRRPPGMRRARCVTVSVAVSRVRATAGVFLCGRQYRNKLPGGEADRPRLRLCQPLHDDNA